MDDAQPAEVPILRTEWAVDQSDFLYQLRRDALEGPEITLAVSLGRLVLLDVIHKNLQAAIHAAMVEIEAEAADFEGFAATFVLSGINSGAEH